MASPYPHLHPVILCGGSDMRLWPLSRELAPKQFMAVSGEDESLLSAAVRRCRELASDRVSVITDERLAEEVSAHLLGQAVLNPEQLDLLVEPYPRGTTFAIALAAAYLKTVDPAAIMFVVPGSHHIVADERFTLAIARAYRLACEDRIALIGTTPGNAGTNHPMITPGRPVKGIMGAHLVAGYTTKPTGSQVYRAMRDGGLWDTGAFMARASLVISELKHAGTERATIDSEGDQRIAETALFLAALGKEHWQNEDAAQVVATLPTTPFEQALLEVSSELGVISTSVEWSSISTLSTLDELGTPDATGNRILGRGLAVDSTDTTVYSDGGRLVTTLGLKDVLVVDTPDTVLVADKHLLPQLSDVTDALREVDAPELVHAAVHAKPWGSLTVLADEGAFKVQRMELLPGHHTLPARDENSQIELTVIAGAGTVRLDTHTRAVAPGDSVGVRTGVRTIISNTGDTPFVIIAVINDRTAPLPPAKENPFAGSGKRAALPHEQQASLATVDAEVLAAGDDEPSSPAAHDGQTPSLFSDDPAPADRG